MSFKQSHPKFWTRGRHLLVTVLLVWGMAVGQLVADESNRAEVPDAKGVEFFEERILPLLKQRCYECHSHEFGKAKGGLVLDSRHGWEKGGTSGPAIVPFKPDESLVIQAIRYDGYEMPPKEKLSADEIAVFEQWVLTGAPDPRESETSTVDANRLWAFQPLQKPEIPAVQDADWPIDDLDHFLLSKLEQQGLQPAPQAPRSTLLRRVTLDLTGLPPTPQEIAEFANDPSAHAFQDVVDRLLNSPAFGDHWARHWFDLACYADLADVQGNILIRDTWRYRDYVIAALNADKPLDLFICEQIAGDLLPSESIAQRREQIIATGYLAIGPWTLQNYIKKQLDADVVDHQIDRIGRTFLGQTISCARCHDHKFDPIPTRDYYALAGIFHSTRTTSYDGPGVWSQITHVTLPQPEVSAEELSQRQQRLEGLNLRRQQLQAELNSCIIGIPGASSANVLTLQAGIAANEKGRHYAVNFHAAPSSWADASQQTTAADGLQIDILRPDGNLLAGFRHDPGPWMSTRDAQTLKPGTFSYEGDGSGDIRIRITSANPGSGRFGGAVDDVTVNSNGEILLQADFNNLLPGAIFGAQADTQLKVLAGTTLPGWTAAGINHSHAVDLGEGNYAVMFFGGEIGSLASAMPITEEEKRAHTKGLEIEKERGSVTSEINQLEMLSAPETALAVRDIDAPTDSPIYKRGDFQSPGEAAARGFLKAVPVSAQPLIPPGTSGRLQLAQWLTAPDNPLTARVLVNRIWQHVFGYGLVRSVDYFGVHGETPSHPELLDFLAARLRDDDHWSVKQTVRRMVLSRAYRMASVHNAHAVGLDPDNRWLWRMPRRRLTAESIRDAMLTASGELDPGRGGSSLGLELEGNIAGAGGNVNPAAWVGKVPESIKNRRSVYLPLRRERPVEDQEILSIFDFPHPNEIVGARPETTVATQALFLMNSPFVKHQAMKLAERLAKDEPSDERARINRLYLLTASRPAELDEIESTQTFLNHCVEDFQVSTEPAAARSAAWVQLCHAMLGSNDFLFRE